MVQLTGPHPSPPLNIRYTAATAGTTVDILTREARRAHTVQAMVGRPSGRPSNRLGYALFVSARVQRPAVC